jgi:hypothetical protein
MHGIRVLRGDYFFTYAAGLGVKVHPDLNHIQTLRNLND